MNKQKNGKALHLEHAAEEICFESLTVKDQEKLQEFGINPSSIPEEVYSIDCSSLNRVWHGIGMRNVHGGVEFISLTEMKRPTTIHRKGITLQPSKKGSVASCCLFSNFMDYLAYLSLSKDGKIALPKECDCIILNHHFNLSHFLVERGVRGSEPVLAQQFSRKGANENHHGQKSGHSGLVGKLHTLSESSLIRLLQVHKKQREPMKIVGIAFGVAVIGIIIAFIYEIKFTYRDGDLWKL